MPIYDYVCDQGHRFEVIHGIHDAGPTECPVCHSTNVRKGFVAPTIHFKGSGWAKKDRSTTAKTGSKAGGDDKAAEPAATSADGSAATGSESTPAAKKVGPDAPKAQAKSDGTD
jgi:putative FmdB family regulatory protein